MGKNLVVAIYSHPEYYPPTLNALEYLSEAYDNIWVLHRNITGFDWKYPANVKLISQKKLLPVRDAEKAGIFQKISWFISFTRLFFLLVRKNNPDTILVYDCMPLLSYRLIYLFIKKPRILWYHNHDVTDPLYLKKSSLIWWAWKSEKWIFPRLDLFTLPALERKGCFPMNRLKGQFAFLPNYPSLKVYARYNDLKKNGDSLVMLYQGSIGEQHGLEEIIPLLGNVVAGRYLKLVLKGFIDPAYLLKLQQIANEAGVTERLIYIGPGGYRSVIENAAHCHVGIGIHKKQDVMNKTLGTASNKIYEYAASGLLVLLYDNEHFRKHLGKYNWAFFTDCTRSSLADCFYSVLKNYEALSQKAREDFSGTLNFEYYFLPVIENIQ